MGQKPILVLHGVLLNVLGRGILLTGSSGSGKSELALRLVRKGHQLVADDVIEISRDGQYLSGAAPYELRGLLHIRGIGVIDIRKMYGPAAFRISARIDNVLNMESLAALDFNCRADKVGISGRPSRSISLLLETVTRSIVRPETICELGSIYKPIHQLPGSEL